MTLRALTRRGDHSVRSVTLILRSLDGVAYTTGSDLDEDHKEIHMSLQYIAGIPDERAASEIKVRHPRDALAQPCRTSRRALSRTRWCIASNITGRERVLEVGAPCATMASLSRRSPGLIEGVAGQSAHTHGHQTFSRTIAPQTMFGYAQATCPRTGIAAETAGTRATRTQ